MRIDIVSATIVRANVDVATENVAASHSRADHGDVAAAMSRFACDLLRRRAAGRSVAQGQATPRTILRLLA